MIYSLHNLAELKPFLLPRLAEIHMGDRGLLAKLGFPFVLRYFEVAYKDPRVIGVYAQDDDSGELIGYGIASPAPESLTSQLTNDKSWFVRQIIKLFFTRPHVFIQLIISSITIKGQMNNENDAVECVYFSVDPKYRGQKIGRTLQKALMDRARAAGYKKIFASIETWNKASLAATLANGFTIVKTFREGMYHRHRLESKL
ncbi:MAG: GNAT family N-acetyltransferase [Chloroflexi bacterium]|nr:GNAT family N-acetyltransferase [Chloroflexota bacterium]